MTTFAEQTRKAISDAYYAARNNGRTMENAADDATTGVLRVLAPAVARFGVAASLTVDDIRAQFGDVIAAAVAESFAAHFERADALAATS